jgi:hypothetical protein
MMSLDDLQRDYRMMIFQKFTADRHFSRSPGASEQAEKERMVYSA